MYCPKCATSNADDVKFCRSCGANLSLVSEALTGRLPRARHDLHNKSAAAYDGSGLGRGITQTFMGVGFLIVAIALLFTGGRGWWWAMLFPAFALLGKGVAEIVTTMMARNSLQHLPAEPQRARNTGEIGPTPDFVNLPPSVTEGTTRQLDPDRDKYRDRA